MKHAAAGPVSSTLPPVGVRLRVVGLTSDVWEDAKVRAARGGPSAVQQLTVALARYVDDPTFRQLVDDTEPAEGRRERNVRLGDRLWADFTQVAPRRRVYATADTALRLHMAADDG